MRGAPIERFSARNLAYVGLLATDSVLVAVAAILVQLSHSAFTLAVVGLGLLLSALHAGCLAFWLRRRFAAPEAGTFLPAWMLGTSAFLFGCLLPAGKDHRAAPSSFPGALDQLASILIAIVSVGAALLLGAALASWFVAVVRIVTRAEATRARDGRQLLLLALNVGWTALAWPFFGLEVLIDSAQPFAGASTGIAFCVALVPTIVVVRIRRDRDRQRTWLRALAREAEEGDDHDGVVPQFAIEPLEEGTDAEQIPPYLTDSRGRYTGVLVRTDATSGARELLGRVR